MEEGGLILMNSTEPSVHGIRTLVGIPIPPLCKISPENPTYDFVYCIFYLVAWVICLLIVAWFYYQKVQKYVRAGQLDDQSDTRGQPIDV